MTPDEATTTSDQATPTAPVAPVEQAPDVAAGAEAKPSSSDATDAPAMPSSPEPEAPAAPASGFTMGQLVLLDKPRPGVTPPPVVGAIIVALRPASDTAPETATIVELGPLRPVATVELRPV